MSSALSVDLESAAFQKIGDLRRALQLAEGDDPPREEPVKAAMSALHALSDHLADWLMQGRHQPDASG
ncbi:hypothetical protein [Nonomuraea recticatena]|uniref:hypothetical protein n=1 Tax=Nonomuraea recticatena TaxID=46178 RepID=UPI0031F91F35